jgi:hypothetical protein
VLHTHCCSEPSHDGRNITGIHIYGVWETALLMYLFSVNSTCIEIHGFCSYLRNTKCIYIILTDSVPTSKKTSHTKISQLISIRKIIAVYSDNQTKFIYMLCG